jgi:hypothetical protein
MRTLTLPLILAFILSATVLPTTQEIITVQGHPVTVNVSPHIQCWRLIHDGVKVIAVFESPGVTKTLNHLFCATTKPEIDAQIASLNLIPLPPSPPAPPPPQCATANDYGHIWFDNSGPNTVRKSCNNVGGVPTWVVF